MTRYEKMSQLFNEDYRVIDFLPGRVPHEAETIFEEVEQYFMQDKQLQVFCDKVIAIVLKLLCYYPFEMYVQEHIPLIRQREGWLKDKRCDTIVKIMKKTILKRKGQIDILLTRENSMLSISGGTLSIAVYNESDSLREMLQPMVHTEGLYDWRFRA
ncbi:hypothetical protein [Blautia pseudococcoides]|uniref:Uncharacterized protein n=1 Tax=Blautia pseudococcoides TaxID=1796616 RepID=A0A1C7I9F4_9FIRM|nr:hypothetical protein [Blautia pseudococcoides]ANU75648.1 hypothetical protein A4V09_07635 [Blautia pseudococcoides]ASU28451.1 hypothetical protein ADH70_006005 [Blautia pseudococcoides]QJU14255.1 hypothetical protein HL650_07120 [Blautia pseudococcoides]QQQ93205.1 hypothetical protein I5Q86_23775 [Blautia pseudococcoides]